MQIRVLRQAEPLNAIDAWLLSRDIKEDYNIESIVKVDAPVMEMPSALLNFENFTILEREIICSLRNHVVWARTSRVDDPRNFSVPYIFRANQHETYRRAMTDQAAQGVPQACASVSPRRQSRKWRRGKIQGSQRGVRMSLGSQSPRRL